MLYFNAELHQLTRTFLNLLILQLGTEQIFRPSMDPKVHFRVHKILPLNHNLNRLNQVLTYRIFFKIFFDVILPCMYLVSYKIKLLMHL